MKLSGSIMAHPVRRNNVGVVLRALDRDVPVSWDTEGKPNSDKQKRWRNGRRAWEMAAPDSEWHVVLQDDVKVCRDFFAGMEKALAHVPADVGIVAPYIGMGRPNQFRFQQYTVEADKVGAHWIRCRSLNWGVAVCVRTPTIPEMLEWCNGQVSLAYDTRVGRYYRDVLFQDTYYIWPCLVDHLEGPSLVGHGNRGRSAWGFWAGSALDLDYDTTVVVERGARRRVYRPPVKTPRHHVMPAEPGRVPRSTRTIVRGQQQLSPEPGAVRVQARQPVRQPVRVQARQPVRPVRLLE